jgi:hypothetical protein
MIDATSNCTRIDAVKALMNQLKLQTVQAPTPEKGSSTQAAAVTDELRTLDSSIKTGDPQKAEIALFHLRNTIRLMATEFDSDRQLAPSAPAADEKSAPLSTYA